ncbi:sarcosine oxidase subunit delta [Mesorhizobium tamadayense]|uniref:Sarcosine oxidase subunit delta n=1 Tax=Mesorhizobium tamadayense TaxID=425306 RepID=A0A3P3FT42_9HYPH|nr:sarcosine oxidase subunit delta [Mesorhizobium tamadayense]RRI01786.1 sarcosine oxidase subunit delta [Mesorhizobium tamadayense]
MRITCPHCGARDVQEFNYLGAADPKRPEGIAAPEAQMFEYVYLRDNPRGDHNELWYHAAGCRAWLIVTRNTLTHSISSVRTAKSTRGAAA